MCSGLIEGEMRYGNVNQDLATTFASTQYNKRDKSVSKTNVQS
jgi:hypothetical protein